MSMETRSFHGRVYGKHENKLYIFEPTWDLFRPIKSVGWDGKKFNVDDRDFKQNIFSPHYGYLSPEQKSLCETLTEVTELGSALEIKDPVEFWKWAGITNTEWFRDRPCVFLNPCVPRNWREYLAYLGKRPKTMRRIPRGSRVTRRLVTK